MMNSKALAIRLLNYPSGEGTSEKFSKVLKAYTAVVGLHVHNLYFTTTDFDDGHFQEYKLEALIDVCVNLVDIIVGHAEGEKLKKRCSHD